MAPSHGSITWLHNGNRIIGMTKYLNDCVAIHSKTKSRGWMIRYCKKRQAGRALSSRRELRAMGALLCDDIM